MTPADLDLAVPLSLATLRDLFAAFALAGLNAAGESDQRDAKELASIAYFQADEMLRTRDLPAAAHGAGG
jgi:hypothetical protein